MLKLWLFLTTYIKEQVALAPHDRGCRLAASSTCRHPRTQRASSARPARLERLHAAALASGWSAFLVMGLFDLTFLKDWPWLAFWLLAGLSSRVDKLDFGGASALRHSAPEERAEARDARS